MRILGIGTATTPKPPPEHVRAALDAADVAMTAISTSKDAVKKYEEAVQVVDAEMVDDRIRLGRIAAETSARQASARRNK